MSFVSSCENTLSGDLLEKLLSVFCYSCVLFYLLLLLLILIHWNKEMTPLSSHYKTTSGMELYYGIFFICLF